MADAQQEILVPTTESSATAATLVVEPSEVPVGSVQGSEEPPFVEKEEEKVVETVEEKKVETVESGERELPAEGPAATPSFKEESYHVEDLKESERKALQELKKKVEVAILSNAFAKRPKPDATRDVQTVKPTDDGKEKADSELKEGEPEVKTESEVKAREAGLKADEETTKDEDLSRPNTEPPKEESAPAVPAELPAATPEEPIVVAGEIPAPTTTGNAAVGGEPPENAVVDKSATAPGSSGGEESVVTVSTREVAIEGSEAAPPEDLDLWGIPLLHTKGDERTDVLLLKFLRARDFKVNDALSMLRHTVLWRKEFQVNSVLEEDFGTDYNTVAYMHGCDKDGHPVCYNDYGIFQDKERYINTFGDESKFNKFLRWRIQVLEKGIQKLNFTAGSVHSMVQITDLKDSPGLLKWIHITRKALTVLQDNYPEFVAKQIFINVPWYFSGLYSVYGRSITLRQKSKVIAARPGKVTETLFKYISPEHVPVKYGGLSRPNDTEFEAAEAPVKVLIIKAGEKQTIELPVEESAARIVWDLAVVGWEVVYGEEFVPTSESGYTVIVQKSKKVPSSEASVRNSFEVTEPGKIVLTIDNSASRRKKHAVYRYVVKKPVPAEN